VNNIRHFTSDRCPVTKLTKLQVYALASVCIGMSTEKNMPNGVYRSLIMRGLLTNTHRLTADGCEALANCQILSNKFRRSLLAMPMDGRGLPSMRRRKTPEVEKHLADVIGAGIAQG
jgi:hypothetical protein